MIPLSLYDAESNVRYAMGFYHPGSFQFNLHGAEMIEQSDTVAKQHRREVNVHHSIMLVPKGL